MKTFLTCCLAALLGFGLLAARPAQAKQHLLLGALPGLHRLLPRFNFFLKGIQFFQTCAKLFFLFI